MKDSSPEAKAAGRRWTEGVCFSQLAAAIAKYRRPCGLCNIDFPELPDPDIGDLVSGRAHFMVHRWQPSCGVLTRHVRLLFEPLDLHL